jgi:pimeloyl-ACP methyl ester carboxylesterase
MLLRRVCAAAALLRAAALTSENAAVCAGEVAADPLPPQPARASDPSASRIAPAAAAAADAREAESAASGRDLQVANAARPDAAEQSDVDPTLGERSLLLGPPRSFRDWLRSKIVRGDDAVRYGLQPLQDEGDETSELPLVVLVHGFNSSPSRNASVLQLTREAGFCCFGFSYPNDQRLADSAVLLSQELRDLARAQPHRRVALVTHSMGGLVARECLENPELDPGNVQRIIMIAPPSQGTLLAHAAVATDVWEHWLGRREGGAWRRWRDSIVDGLGEAAADLQPGSEFLAQLNGRPRHARAAYTLLLGTDAAVSAGEMEWIRETLRGSAGRLPGLRGATLRFDALLDDLDEVVSGKGDGVVAVKRGRVEGVHDVLVLPFGHLTVTDEPADDDDACLEAVREVQQVVLARLRDI